MAVETIKAIYAAVAAGDLAAALDQLSPSIVVTQSPALPFGGKWHGKDRFQAMGAAIYEAWPDFEVVPLAFFADGDGVLVLTRVTGATASPTPLDQPMIERWRVADGVATECQPFYFDPVAAAASAHKGD